MDINERELDINIFEWTFLQEMMLQYVQDEIDPEVTLGTYNHHVTNLHLYDFTGEQGYAVLENKLKQKRGVIADDEIEFPGIEDVHEFFGELVDYFSELITQNEIFDDRVSFRITEIFDKYKVFKNGNILFTYAELILIYIEQKKSKLQEKPYEKRYEFSMSDEFYKSIEDSRFRKFQVTQVG